MLTASIYALFVVLGVSSTLFGLILADVTETLGISLANAGLVTTLFAVGRTAGSFLTGIATDRWGVNRPTAINLFVMLGGLALVAAAGHVAAFFLGSFIMGLAFGGLDVTLNLAITVLYPDRRAAMLSLLHAFYGVGSFAGPLALSFLLTHGPTWRALPAATAVLYALTGLFFSSLASALDERQVRIQREARDTSGGSRPEGAGTHSSVRKPLHALRGPQAFLLIVPIGFIYQGVSWGLSLWLPTYMAEVHGASPLRAAAAVSALFLGLTVGRFVNSVVTLRIGDANMLLFSAVGSLAGLSLSLAATTTVGTLVALGATGFFLAALIPTSIALLTALLPQAAGAASGTFMMLSATGVLLFPWLLGVLSERWGMRISLAVSLLALSTLVLDVLVLKRLLRRLGTASS